MEMLLIWLCARVRLKTTGRRPKLFLSSLVKLLWSRLSSRSDCSEPRASRGGEVIPLPRRWSSCSKGVNEISREFSQYSDNLLIKQIFEDKRPSLNWAHNVQTTIYINKCESASWRFSEYCENCLNILLAGVTCSVLRPARRPPVRLSPSELKSRWRLIREFMVGHGCRPLITLQ